MENNKNKKNENPIKPEIKNDQGFKITYHKKQFGNIFPNLNSEIKQKDKMETVKLPLIEKKYFKLNSSESEETSYEENLSDPGVFDFLRRCVNNEEALSIIKYLNMRNELSNDLYEKLLKIIKQDGGLDWLIQQCGGAKKPGYYIDKFYSKHD